MFPPLAHLQFAIVASFCFGLVAVHLAQDLHAQVVVVHGTVIDRAQGHPLAAVQVSIHGEGTSTRTDARGRFELLAPSQTVRLRVESLGYLPWEEEVQVGADPLRIPLTADPLRLEGFVVRSPVTGTASLLQPSALLTRSDLAERMATSVAAMVAEEPGVHVRTNGPMATQPIIRGLSGDRVVVLEDGLRGGDVSTTAPDHAVTIEPSTVENVEVIRGPAGLAFGSNTLGGVVNVRRYEVPRSLVPDLEWGISTFGESVNRGGSLSGDLRGSTGTFAFQVGGGVRRAGDTRTPGGSFLPFTDLSALDGGAGLSLVRDGGFLGAAVRGYQSRYGVPSSYDGVTLPGSHVGGVYVEVDRISGRTQGEWQVPGDGPLESVSGGINAVRFEQWEFEEGGFVGTRFGQLSSSGELVLRFSGERHQGAVGASGFWHDRRAEGSFTGTRPARQHSLALFAVDQIQVGRSTKLVTGLRVDRQGVVPLERTETLLVRDIRPRRFTAVTGALGLQRSWGSAWDAGVQAARAFRAPTIEELFSAGPHLASYSYEIGDPSLEAEVGIGVDGVLRWQGDRGRAELSVFGMWIDDYITFAPQIDEATGLPMRDPRLRRYVVFAPEQGDARLLGVELSSLLMLSDRWGLATAADLLHARAADGSPLPEMPPPTLRAELRRLSEVGTFAVNLQARGPQRRVPAAPAAAEATCDPQVVNGEAAVLPSTYCPTSGTVLLGARLALDLESRGWGFPQGWGIPGGRLTVSVDNLLDTRWRDPLWRAKQVAPQPGRNLRIGMEVRP